MRTEVNVMFKGSAPLRINLVDVPPMPGEAARAWLDLQFMEMDCEPLRPTGKLLTADKVVVVAQAAGTRKFADTAWAQNFARAASAALGKPVIQVDVTTLSISY